MTGLRLLFVAILLLGAAPSRAQPGEAIDRVWSGHSVNFALVVTKRRIFVGYYDAQRRLTVASRDRRLGAWQYEKLDSRVGWDSHNYVAMAVDADGQLHVAANMHNDPLVYFRTSKAGEVATLAPVPVMVDPAVERRMTYPLFLKDARGRLIFKYRDGGSGNGSERLNLYDPATKAWRALLDGPLIDGEGRRNAYAVGPVLGPDRRFHLAWVWRDSPDAATNHDLSYARSSDMVRWERSDGTPLALPIRLASAEIVDPVPVRGGMINNNSVIGFDRAGRPVITFHKFDRAGNTQIYVARREAKGWHVAQASDWKGFRWDFGGGGSLVSRLRVQGAVSDGRHLRIRVVRDGAPIDLLLDPHTLARRGERPAPARVAIAVPTGMQLNMVEASGYAIAWAARPPNRDEPSNHIPAPTPLMLLKQSGNRQ